MLKFIISPLLTLQGNSSASLSDMSQSPGGSLNRYYGDNQTSGNQVCISPWHIYLTSDLTVAQFLDLFDIELMY